MILPVTFKGRRLAAGYRVDLVCFGAVVVEPKALAAVGGAEAGQVIKYLKASGLPWGLLLNFGGRRLEYRRFIWSARPPSA